MISIKAEDGFKHFDKMGFVLSGMQSMIETRYFDFFFFSLLIVNAFNNFTAQFRILCASIAPIVTHARIFPEINITPSQKRNSVKKRVSFKTIFLESKLYGGLEITLNSRF